MVEVNGVTELDAGVQFLVTVAAKVLVSKKVSVEGMLGAFNSNAVLVTAVNGLPGGVKPPV